MPPYTGTQKTAISQFVALTEAKDSVAVKFLKNALWDVERAANAYFTDFTSSGRSPLRKSLSSIFDKYCDDTPADPDTIGLDGAMQFLTDIGVKLDEVACLGVLELCKTPTMGEFRRDEFIAGWRHAQCDTIDKMRSYIKTLRTRIPSDPELFRRVYRYSFPLLRMQGQRNLQFEIASDQWQLFFTADRGGASWNTDSTPWLDWWLEFLEGRGKKPVNKDLWEQTEVFMRKTREDEQFGWWSADGAWPGALDDFVAFVQAKRGNEMEVE
ncbi:DUF298 domain protein [Penicillium macrosclerotiorum]|uniref:DUF298 domain protein n=1 Tax=Penicillium macrosclerotiorum TaxID=303699 RepID=UPI002548DCFA|nr:DUF298 domain protein [Penicillium macrosclerotiorum]KAJ5690659.1 DUF298 domain protein [Penicillium macrosclerotiorum]